MLSTKWANKSINCKRLRTSKLFEKNCLLSFENIFLISCVKRLEKEKQLVKSEVDEAKLQTDHALKAKVNWFEQEQCDDCFNNLTIIKQSLLHFELNALKIEEEFGFCLKWNGFS